MEFDICNFQTFILVGILRISCLPSFESLTHTLNHELNGCLYTHLYAMCEVECENDTDNVTTNKQKTFRFISCVCGCDHRPHSRQVTGARSTVMSTIIHICIHLNIYSLKACDIFFFLFYFYVTRHTRSWYSYLTGRSPLPGTEGRLWIYAQHVNLASLGVDP